MHQCVTFVELCLFFLFFLLVLDAVVVFVGSVA